MPSLRSHLLKRGIKFGVKRLSRLKSKGMAERRLALDNVAGKLTKLPPNCKIESAEIEGLYCEWISNDQTVDGKIILYLHGGAYVACSARTHRSLAARIMIESGVKVLLPEYRLAPEHPFPAAIEDAVSIYRWLLNQGYDPESIIFAGDSAGGGLSLATTLYLRDNSEPLPAALVLLSPWADLTSSGESYKKNKRKDPYLNIDGARKAALAYAGEEPLDHQLISPVFADYTGFPPLFIQVGSIEILLSDAETLAKKAREAGVDVTYKAWKGMWHVWQVSNKMPESKKAIKEIGRFIKGRLIS